jgi:hypothetical protein
MVRFPVLGALLFVLAGSLGAQEAPGRVTIFLPAGAQARLTRDAEGLNLSPGIALPCPPGTWDLLVTGDGYEPSDRTIVVAPDRDLVVVPRLVPSARSREVRDRAVAALEARNRAVRGGFAAASVATGAAALAGWAAVGVFEGILASQKAGLADRQAAYRSASAAEAPGLWPAVEAQRSTIDATRTWESASLAAAAGLSAAAAGLWALGEAVP